MSSKAKLTLILIILLDACHLVKGDYPFFKAQHLLHYNSIIGNDTFKLYQYIDQGSFLAQQYSAWFYGEVNTWHQERTGIANSSRGYWMHPPRKGQFEFMEVVPFPEVRVGNQPQSWQRTLYIPKGQFGPYENQRIRSSYYQRTNDTFVGDWVLPQAKIIQAENQSKSGTSRIIYVADSSLVINHLIVELGFPPYGAEFMLEKITNLSQSMDSDGLGDSLRLLNR